MMYKSTRILKLWLLLFAFSHVTTVSAAETDTLPDRGLSGIHFKAGYFRVSVKNQKFQKVMDEVAKKAGIKIAINDNTDEDLTVNFGYLTLEKGLKHLLKGRNYVFLYDSDGAQQSSGLSKVLVFPKSEGWTAARSEGLVKDRFSDLEQQAVIMKNVRQIKIPDNLDEVFPSYHGNGADLKKQLEAAVDKVQEMNILQEVEKLEDSDIRQKMIRALGGIQDITR